MLHRSIVSSCRVFVAVAALHACAPVDGDVEGAAPGSSVDEITACGANQHAAAATASVAQDGNPATSAIDGNLSTRWSGSGVGAYLTVDLGAAKTVCSVGVAWYNGNARRNHFAVSLSTDGTHFTQAYAGDSTGTTAGTESYAVTPSSARYVRLTVNGNTQNDWASVSEITVAASSGFVHPGVLVDRAQLDYVKGRIAAGAEPWASAFNRVRSSHFSNTSYTPHPRAVVECGPSSNPDNGCTDEMSDAIAAYTQALLWYHTGNAAYAQRSIAIMNAWASTLTSHTNSNAPLQSAWASEVWPRAGEIIRYTYTGWSASDIARFTTMLTNVYLPEVENGWWGGNNWQTSMTEATMNIAVFTDNHTVFDHAVSMWRAGTPAYVYLTSDGALPVRPIVGTFTDAALRSNWHSPPRFVDGLTMETCRDLGHTSMGLAAIFNAAETARIQGVDLYTEQQRRLTAAMEFNTAYMNGAAVPSWLCTGSLATGGAADMLTYEVGYNAYANRAHVSLPQTHAWVLHNRPTVAALHLDWETLTHGDLDAAGVH